MRDAATMTAFAKFFIDFNILVMLFAGIHLGMVDGQACHSSYLL